MADFKYGVYGTITDSVVSASTEADTAVVYLGTFPVNLITDYAEKNVVNYPVKLSNMTNAQKQVGYSENWEAFTGCEAIAAHFDNAKGNVGNIYVINVLDPATHKKEAKTSVTLSFKNGKAEIASDTIILDTLTIEDKVKGVDYSVSYNFTKMCAVISSLDEEISGTISATYQEVDTTLVEYTDIIGADVDGVLTGAYVLKLMYPELNVVPSLVLAPTWTENASVYKALVNLTDAINGHWKAFVLADIPCTSEVNTIAKAVAWKKENAYTHERSKVCYPKAVDTSNRVYHLSTLNAVEFMRADLSHNGTPCETSGNKTCGMNKQYFYDGYKGYGFDKEAAMDLVANGISTLISWGGLVLWGDSTAAYSYENVSNIDPRAIFDVSMRMLIHLVNGFQLRNTAKIDEPMTVQLKDTIINSEQEILDMYVSQGALLGTPTIEFIESENPTSEVMQGNFVWNIPVTPTPPFRSGTAEVCYTNTGFSSYFGEGA